MAFSITELFSKNDVDVMQETVAKLQSSLFSRAPFYAEIMSQLKFIENKNVPIAATDGLFIYYNTKYMQGLSEGQRNYIIMHELYHVILLHCLRDDGKDPRIWNIAADCVVNSFVDQFAMRMKYFGIPFNRPDEGCFLDDFDYYSVEELYDILSAGTKLERKWQTIIVSFGNRQIDLMVNASKEEQEYIKQLISSIIDRASAWGGEGSFATTRLLNMLAAKKRLPWKRLLKRMWMQQEEEDSSYLTPERKYLHMGLIVSGWGVYETEKLPEIWAFIDSSGSIEDGTINEFLAQLYIISKEFGAALNIAYWDVSVKDVYLNIKDPAEVGKCIPHSSGGTYADCIYDYLQVNKIVPDAMLIFTDGQFDEVPDTKVGKLKTKTIVVLDGEGKGKHSNLGKEARL